MHQAVWAEGNITVSGFSGGWCAWGEKDNVAVLFGKENRVHYGFSLENGNFLWETAPENYLNAWELLVSGTDSMEQYLRCFSRQGLACQQAGAAKSEESSTTALHVPTTAMT